LTSTRQLLRWQIRVTGVVQGVGFRPFVYKLAAEHGLTGWVLNDARGVLTEVQGDEQSLALFRTRLATAAPPQARVDAVEVTSVPQADEALNAFTIRESIGGGPKLTIVPTDTSVCEDCLTEFRDPADRRFGYPFINCTNCGPRYSIVQGLPYDRAQTTMASFTMCHACRNEYTDPLNRRYHAQPNACVACGPRFSCADAAGGVTLGVAAMDQAAKALLQGQIVAIKSIGGFHLAVNATDAEAVARLRRLKRRDVKPFAVMARDLATVAEFASFDAGETALISSPARPIVLLRKLADALPENIAPRNPNLGVMLPSAPHHHLLTDRPGLAVLVMTSGNISGYPVAYRNEDALDQLFQVADLILYHDRDIEVRIDDSVVRQSVNPELDQPVITFLRRARGYAPYPVEVGHELAPIVAYGAELKTTVALADGSKVYVSQHVGDLKNDETFESHQSMARHIARLHDLTPTVAAVDLHPQFRSTVSAQADASIGKVERVQHHHAHMASCMAENRIAGPAVGVIFDGAGYGTDGTIWGGEFLVGDYLQVERVARLRPLPLLGGDRAVREPIRTGFALALQAFGTSDAALAAFPALGVLDEQHRHVYSNMAARGINSPLASSMGRLFDAVAALLGLCATAEYEAQGPIELEGLLGRDLSMSDADECYRFDVTRPGRVSELDPAPMVRAMSEDLRAAVPTAVISRRFHSTVVELVVAQCQEITARPGAPTDVVLSGGVFLNEFLLMNCMGQLRRAGLRGYCQQQVPTNDGGIALGQVMVAHARLTAAGLAGD
jgi:hydrogenase maturation protein HypF